MTAATPDSQDEASSLKNCSPSAEPNSSQQRVVRKRVRAVLSCGPCRVQKLKCDRTMPCSRRTKRNQAAACSYEASCGETGRVSARPAARSNVVRTKIDRLEKLVLSLMKSNSDLVPTTRDQTTPLDEDHCAQPHESHTSLADDKDGAPELDGTDRLAKYFGHIQFSDDNSAYVGDSHWATILHELSEVRSHLAGYEEDYRDVLDSLDAGHKQAAPQGPAFLLAGRSPFGLTELIHRLPRRIVVDQLVERYFGNYDVGNYILHVPSWRRRYDSYWSHDKPENSDPAFLAQLFAICGLAMQSYCEIQDEPVEFAGRTRDLAAMYRGLTQQSLQLVDYNRINQTTVETYILYTYAEYQRTGAADIEIWILLRMTISLAMRLGMHRDVINFSGVTPFQGELRRRQWAFLRMADVIWSFTVGLPVMIKESDTDTQLPLNLNDSDFDEKTQTMPPARPWFELTNCSYLIAKTSIASGFAKIIAAVTGIGSIDYEDVVKLNAEVQDIYQNIFPALQMRLFDDFTQDDSKFLLPMRLDLAILYNKAVCVLHRRYLTISRKNSRFRQSRQACVDAALIILRIQQLVSKESQFGGQLYQLRAHVAAFMTHDSILAATLVGLDILATIKIEAAGQRSGDLEIWGVDRKEEEIKALEQARIVWDDLRGQYVEASKAYKMCSVMIQNIHQIRKKQIPNGVAAQHDPAPTSTAAGKHERGQSQNVTVTACDSFSRSSAGSHSINVCLSAQVSGPLDSTAINFDVEPAGPSIDLDTFSFPDMRMEGIDELDWNMWDEFVQNANFTSL